MSRNKAYFKNKDTGEIQWLPKHFVNMPGWKDVLEPYECKNGDLIPCKDCGVQEEKPAQSEQYDLPEFDYNVYEEEGN